MKNALIAASVLIFATACAGPYRASYEPSSADRQARSEQPAGSEAGRDTDIAAMEGARNRYGGEPVQPLNMEIFQPPQTF